MQYRLDYSEEAKRALRTAPGNYRQRFRQTIEGLASNPRPDNAEELREPGYYKIKFDRWRLIYYVGDTAGVVRILRVKVKIGPETYQGLEDEAAKTPAK